MRTNSPLSLSAAALLALACASNAVAATWTVMYYVVVDERTEGSERRALEGIPGRVARATNVNCVMQYDTHQAAAVRCVADKGRWQKVDEKVSDNFGAPETLYRFLDWAVLTYPADRYVLFLGGHGSGWEDKWGPVSLQDRARPTDWIRSDLLGRLGLDGTTRRSGTYAPREEKGTAYDYDDKDCLTLQEQRVALEELVARRLGGRKLDLLAYSSCWQMNLESLLEQQDAARYVLGCETTSWTGTTLFSCFLSTLAQKPDVAVADVCDLIGKTYLSESRNAETVAWFDTDGLEAVQTALDRLAAELLRVNLHPKAHAVRGPNFPELLFTDSEHHPNEERFADVTALLDAVEAGRVGFTPTTATVKAAQDLRAALRANGHAWCRGEFGKHQSSGISLYLPRLGSSLRTVQGHLSELRIGQETHWADYLACAQDVGFDHERTLEEDLLALGSRAARLAELEQTLPGHPAGSAARVVAEREAGHLVFLQGHLLQLLADQAILEVSEEDGAGLKTLAEAAEHLPSELRPIVGGLTKDLVAAVAVALQRLAESEPRRCAKLAKHLTKLQEALGRTDGGSIERLPGE